jgi:hypothetical protein
MRIILSVLFLLAISVSASQTDSFPPIPPRDGIGTVHIETMPPGSGVFLDGESLGRSPVKTEFRSGRWNLLIIDQGFQLAQERFNVWPDSVNSIYIETNLPIGNIEVRIPEKKCFVFLNGIETDEIDKGTLTIRNINTGNHLVSVQCGRHSEEKMVEVPAEGTVIVEF